jgi:hypothetical protein
MGTLSETMLLLRPLQLQHISTYRNGRGGQLGTHLGQLSPSVFYSPCSAKIDIGEHLGTASVFYDSFGTISHTVEIRLKELRLLLTKQLSRISNIGIAYLVAH